jgi:hypothetical protein
MPPIFRKIQAAAVGRTARSVPVLFQFANPNIAVADRVIVVLRWQRVNIEFEFESRNFRVHGHPLSGCDVIVCWHHNWDDCPAHIEVLELSSFIKSLRRSQD